MSEDDSLYAQVANEIAQGKLDAGMWAKAIAHSDGSENSAKSFYIRFRVSQMKEQLASFKSNLSNSKKVTCPYCGHHEEAEATPRGNAAECIFFYLIFIIPGIIYTLMRSGFTYTCKNCKATLSTDKVKIY
jgi:DNA-directed RNA polymerase subunit RPC12/RpoP